jgi:CRP-like cAMP-binding protein
MLSAVSWHEPANIWKVQGLTLEDIERLATAGRVERIARRSIVPLDGPTLMIVIDGWFRVFRNAAFVRDVTLFLAHTGDVLAANSLFGERSAESGAEAIGDASVVVLSREAFEQFAADDPGLYVKLAGNLGRRVSRIQQKIEAVSRATVEARVAVALLDIADDFGVPVAAGTRLDLPLSQEDLASLAGTSRESCSQAVAAFARSGFVKGSRLRGLIVTDRDGLRALLP